MRIAIIGEEPRELTARFAMNRHVVVVYRRVILSILRACLLDRPDVIHLFGVSACRFRWLVRLLAPNTDVFADSQAPIGVPIRRVATDDTVLSPFKLRSGDYYLIVRKIHGSQVFDAVAQESVSVGVQIGEVRKALFAGAKFVVIPDGSLLTALEAMSYGKAVVVPEIFHETDCVVTYSNQSELKQRVMELLQDPMRTASIGHVARHFVEDEYTFDAVATKILARYETKLNDRAILAEYEAKRS